MNLKFMGEDATVWAKREGHSLAERVVKTVRDGDVQHAAMDVRFFAIQLEWITQELARQGSSQG